MHSEEIAGSVGSIGIGGIDWDRWDRLGSVGSIGIDYFGIDPNRSHLSLTYFTLILGEVGSGIDGIDYQLQKNFLRWDRLGSIILGSQPNSFALKSHTSRCVQTSEHLSS
jgi:hypothetical protein